MESTVLLEDLDYIANSNLPFEKYQGKTFLITGVTGFIGSLLVKTLLHCNKKHNLNLKIIGIVRNLDKVSNVYDKNIIKENIEFIERNLEETIDLTNLKVDYIIHAAAVTSSKDMVTFPVDNIKTSLNGTMSILECAAKQKLEGMVYISSMEVYGAVNSNNALVTENELGYLDLASARSCYPESKRLCECLCNAYYKQYGVRVVNARLAQTFGAGILAKENRVFAQFARSAIKGENIVLHTKGLSEGNYVYSRDAILAILLLLTEGMPGNAYNVSNEKSHMSIGMMAELVAEKIANNKIKVVYDIPKEIASLGYAPDVKLHLSSSKLQRLGWIPKVDLIESYERMICYMREKNM